MVLSGASWELTNIMTSVSVLIFQSRGTHTPVTTSHDPSHTPIRIIHNFTKAISLILPPLLLRCINFKFHPVLICLNNDVTGVEVSLTVTSSSSCVK